MAASTASVRCVGEMMGAGTACPVAWKVREREERDAGEGDERGQGFAHGEGFAQPEEADQGCEGGNEEG